MKISRYVDRMAIAAGLALMMVGTSGPALASFVPNIVYTTSDSGPGSLRDAIANTPANGVVHFALAPNSTIVLTSGPLIISKNLTLNGNPPANNVIISGNEADRVIRISEPVSVTLTWLTITGGRVKDPCDGGPFEGGGILAQGGQLTVANSIITGNQASCTAATLPVGDGGGIYTNGSLTIRNSRVENNLADSFFGGVGGVLARDVLFISDSIVRGNIGAAAIRGIGATAIARTVISDNTGDGLETSAVDSAIDATQIMRNTGWGIFSGALTVTGSTISGNARGGLYNYGRLALVNSTVSGNGGASHSSFGALGQFNPNSRTSIASSTIVNNTSGDNPAHSGLTVDAGVVEMQNSIVADNGITNNFAISTSASLISLGYNLTNSTDVLTATGDLTGTLPLLGPLQNNGGPTPTHALLPGSPAIDAANPVGCAGAGSVLLTSDQRGYPREADGNGDSARRCDIGAYEVWNPTDVRYLPFLPN